MKKYIVGIDFGHGETAAWVVPVIGTPETGMKADGESLKLRVSTTSANDKLMDSVVYRSKSGVFSLERHDCSDIYTELKSPVSLLVRNPAKKEAYVAYIQLLVERLLSANSTLLCEEDGEWNFHLCIACPTKWGEKETSDYIQFFNEALSEKGLSLLWIINESDAAFFTHRPKENPNQCVLVVDYGSSTIDYTVIYNGKKVSDDSWSNAQLGASCIERAARTAYKRASDGEYQNSYTNTERILNETDNGHMSVESRLLYNMRKQKEESFKNGTYPGYHLDFNFGTYTGLVGKQNPFRSYSFEFYGDLESITADYRKAVLADFKKLKDRITDLVGSKGAERIVLSGGACNMQWVKRMLQSVFTEAEIVEDREPSYVVAKGIALYAQAQLDAEESFRHEVESLPFINMYKSSTTKGEGDAIRLLIENVIDEIKRTPNLTGWQIHERFLDFMRTISPDNIEVWTLIQRETDKCISERVADSLQTIILNKFNKRMEEKDKEEVRIHIEGERYFFTEANFNPGGALYDNFKMWIGRAFSSWRTMNFDKTRTRDEINEIADKVKVFVLEFVSGDYNNYMNEPDADNIRIQTTNQAMRLFYSHQLFKTTFCNS